jgi:uroporphyrinogen decarboxylase
VLAAEDGRFQVLLHNCGARLVHLSAVLESGPSAFHFGSHMDIAAALGRIPAEIVLCGNLDPTAIFLQSTTDQISLKTAELLTTTRDHRNYVISSGCDIPPASPLANLDAFHEAVARS